MELVTLELSKLVGGYRGVMFVKVWVRSLVTSLGES